VRGGPDVAVIGGGIVGTATAAFLAAAGARVTLYEREALAAGASGRNSGVVQHPFDLSLGPLYRETVSIYRGLVDETGWTIASFDQPPAGILLLSRHERLVQALTNQLRGTLPELRPSAVDGPELERLEPALAGGLAACRLEMAYPIVPSAPTYAFATLAERRGVVIRLGRPAKPALGGGGRCIGVEVAGQVEAAGSVVVAAGPWTPELVDPSGAWRPIRPRWGVVVETRLTEPPRHVMEEAEMDEALGTGSLTAETEGTAGDRAAEPQFSLVTAAGTSAVGSTFLADEPDPAAWAEPLLRRATEFVPALLEAPIRDVHACARPVALDGRPLVGRIPWIDGLFVAAGHGPWGISTGPASARQVADLVVGRAPDIAPAFDPARFPPARSDQLRPGQAR
jgi:D-hydroxyproline dehydrogenase subunit beta